MKASIVTKYSDICAFCGSPTRTKHHLVFGTSERKVADRDGLWIPVCDDCHNMGVLSNHPVRGHGTMIIHGNVMAEMMSKMIGQLAWEKEYYRSICIDRGLKEITEDDSRVAFRDRYGRSYL